MKTKISLVILGVMLFCGTAFADVVISLKDGNVYKWKDYTETKESYCALNPDTEGDFCISKSDVASVREAKTDIEPNKEPTTKVESTPIPTRLQKKHYKTQPIKPIY
jgi:hypothetical protein